MFNLTLFQPRWHIQHQWRQCLPFHVFPQALVFSCFFSCFGMNQHGFSMFFSHFSHVSSTFLAIKIHQSSKQTGRKTAVFPHLQRSVALGSPQHPVARSHGLLGARNRTPPVLAPCFGQVTCFGIRCIMRGRICRKQQIHTAERGWLTQFNPHFSTEEPQKRLMNK